jgi:hypothetical protein
LSRKMRVRRARVMGAGIHHERLGSRCRDMTGLHVQSARLPLTLL